jgi:hypothetical protein
VACHWQLVLYLVYYTPWGWCVCTETSELRVQQSYISNNVHLVATINWIHWSILLCSQKSAKSPYRKTWIQSTHVQSISLSFTVMTSTIMSSKWPLLFKNLNYDFLCKRRPFPCVLHVSPLFFDHPTLSIKCINYEASHHTDSSTAPPLLSLHYVSSGLRTNSLNLRIL